MREGNFKLRLKEGGSKIIDDRVNSVEEAIRKLENLKIKFK